jgi:MFS family permease
LRRAVSFTLNSVLRSIVPDEMRGRVMGIWALIFGGMIPLGSLEAGLMADFLGTPATMAICALICALAAFVTLYVIRKREAQLDTSAPRVHPPRIICCGGISRPLNLSDSLLLSTVSKSIQARGH